MEIVFTKPGYLWLLLSLPAVVLLHYITNRYAVKRALAFANFAALERVARKPVISAHLLFLVLRLLTLLAVLAALAGATIFYVGKSNDFDFVVALDASSSMLAQDFEPTRLDAAKEMLAVFLEDIPSDSKVGIVSFSGTSYIDAFMTSDRNSLLDSLQNVDVKPIGGTDMGEAIITATNMLLSTDKSRAVIMISDGESNVGVPIDQAVEYANKHNVAVHTVGIGTEEGGLFEEANVTLKLDEETLKYVANSTSGTYSRASTAQDLSEAYKRISLATTAKRLSFSLGLPLIGIAIVLLFIDWVLASTKYRVIP